MAFQYVYDKAGRLTLDSRTAYWETGDAVPAAPASYTYSDPLSYDATHQLQQAGAESYQHSSGGQPQQYHGGSVTVGTGNRLLADRNWTYTHDAEGNLIQKVAKDPPGALFSSETGENSSNKWTYQYDHANRLVQAVKTNKNDPSSTPLLTVTYDYDVFGQLLRRSQPGTSAGSGVTWFAYDGAHVYADLSDGGSLFSRYLRGDAPDQLFGRLDVTTSSWYVTDRQGSVVTVLTHDGQLVRKRVAYRGFSALPVCSCSWAEFNDRYEYTGREFDATTRLQYNRARWYNPYSGQWISEDPEGFGAGDTNLYRYAGNSPANARDPSGRDWTWDDTKQVGLWVLDNTLGLANNYQNKVLGVPDVYGAIRHGNARRLIPFSTWYFDGKAIWDSYQAYKADGMSEEDALGFTVAHHTPIVSSIFGVAEIIAGYSSRPGEVGKPLTPGDYATRGLNVVRDVGLTYVGARGPLPRLGPRWNPFNYTIDSGQGIAGSGFGAFGRIRYRGPAAPRRGVANEINFGRDGRTYRAPNEINFGRDGRTYRAPDAAPATPETPSPATNWLNKRLEAARGTQFFDYLGKHKGIGTFDLNAPGRWTSSVGQPGEQIVYIYYNKKTGQLLKVGSAPGGRGGSARILQQYPKNRAAEARRLGVNESEVELGVDYIRLDPSVPTTGPTSAELLLRVELRRQGHQLPLDWQGLKNITPSDFPELP